MAFYRDNGISPLPKEVLCPQRKKKVGSYDRAHLWILTSLVGDARPKGAYGTKSKLAATNSPAAMAVLPDILA